MGAVKTQRFTVLERLLMIQGVDLAITNVTEFNVTAL